MLKQIFTCAVFCCTFTSSLKPLSAFFSRSKTTKLRQEIEQQSKCLPEDLKKEYCDFMLALHKTSKFNEKTMFKALLLERHLREDARDTLMQRVETSVNKKFHSHFEKHEVDFQLWKERKNYRIIDPFNLKRDPFEKRQKIVKELVITALDEHEADINAQKSYIETWRDYDTLTDQEGRQFVMIREKKVWGETALMLAAYYGYIDVVRYLLERGASKSMRDDFGKTAYDYAQDRIRDERTCIDPSAPTPNAYIETEEIWQNKRAIQELVFDDSTVEKEIKKGFEALNQRGTHIPQVIEAIICAYAAPAAATAQATPSNPEIEAKEREEKEHEIVIHATEIEQPQQRTLTSQQQHRINEALFASVLSKEAPVVSMDELLTMQAQLDAQDAEGRTPLMIAVIANRPNYFTSLLTKITSLGIPGKEILDMADFSGKNALDWARHYKRDHMMAQLLAAGVHE